MADEHLDIRLARLEERVKTIMANFDDLNRFYISTQEGGDLTQRITILEREVELIDLKFKNKVEKNEFWPVKAIVYGISGITLLGVLYTLLSTIGLHWK